VVEQDKLTCSGAVGETGDELLQAGVILGYVLIVVRHGDGQDCEGTAVQASKHG